MLEAVDTSDSVEGLPQVSIPSSLPPRPARLNEIVVASLIDAIISGNISVGSSLPPEQALCQEFRVSRSVTRESIKILEEKGLVVARQGQGTTVQPVHNWNLLDPLVLDAYIRHDHSLAVFDDLMEVRAALEAQMASRAATGLTEDQLAKLSGRIVDLESLLDDTQGYTAADLAYHDLIAQYSGHLLARSILRTVQPVALVNAYYVRTHRSIDDNLRSHRGHVAIYDALLERNAEKAARAVEEHILGGWKAYKLSLRVAGEISSQGES